MKDIVVTFDSGKTIHYLNSKYHHENGDIIITEYDADNIEIDRHCFPESKIEKIKYEG